MATGSAGPDIKIPKLCSTIELKDLADTRDFHDAAPAGSIFGFELTSEGLYKRHLIEIKTSYPRLEQIKNLDSKNAAENKDYTLKKVGKDWKLSELIDDIKWNVRFEFISPYTFVKDLLFIKALNSGPLIVSLVPDSINKNIQIAYHRHNTYLIHKASIASNEALVRFNPPIPNTYEFTIVLDIVLRSKDQPTVTLMPGVKATWNSSVINRERSRVLIYVMRARSIPLTVQSSKEITVNVDINLLNDLTYIDLTAIDLVGFYYVDRFLLDSEREKFSELLQFEDMEDKRTSS